MFVEHLSQIKFVVWEMLTAQGGRKFYDHCNARQVQREKPKRPMHHIFYDTRTFLVHRLLSSSPAPNDLQSVPMGANVMKFLGFLFYCLAWCRWFSSHACRRSLRQLYFHVWGRLMVLLFLKSRCGCNSSSYQVLHNDRFHSFS